MCTHSHIHTTTTTITILTITIVIINIIIIITSTTALEQTCIWQDDWLLSHAGENACSSYIISNRNACLQMDPTLFCLVGLTLLSIT